MKEILPVALFFLIVLAFSLHYIFLTSFTVVAVAAYIGYNTDDAGVAGAIVGAFFALLGVAAFLLLDYEWS